MRGFLAALLGRILLGAVVGFACLVVPAWLYLRAAPDGALATAGAWSLVGVYAVAGGAGGALLGALGALARHVTMFEQELARWLTARIEAREARRWPLAELGLRGDEVVEQVMGGVAWLPLPGLLRRLIRGRLRRILVEDFLDDCRARGLATAGLPEFAGWLLARGPARVTAPVLGQLWLWRAVVAGALVVLAAVPVGLLLRGGS